MKERSNQLDVYKVVLNSVTTINTSLLVDLLILIDW